MIDNRYLENYQRIIYRTFVNALNKEQVSHAYLLSGEPGTPLLACATYLAKSLICDNPNPLACNTCFTCLRLEEGNYADFILLDGSQKTIKKDGNNTKSNSTILNKQKTVLYPSYTQSNLIKLKHRLRYSKVKNCSILPILLMF